MNLAQEDLPNAEKRLLIRPLKDNEYESYFRMRFETAKKYNSRLIKEKTELEIDAFDRQAIHIAAFQQGTLIGSVRLVFPKPLKICLEEFQERSILRNLHQTRLKEQEAINQSTLPVSIFLGGESRGKLEHYFDQVQKQGQKISEIGRLINFAEASRKYRHIPDLIRYVWALNQYLKIDFCFLTSTPRHARFYERSFACKPILPGLLSEAIDPDQKYILRADINHPSENHQKEIHAIRTEFETHGFCPVTR